MEPFKNIMVCYDGYRQISWVNQEEFQELKNNYSVEWYGVRHKDVLEMHHFDDKIDK